MRIIFMGTPDFAVPSLDILVQNGLNVVAVITSTDKYGGRGGKKLIESAIKKYAVSKEIPVLQPKNLKNPEFLEELASYKADLQLVVAFRMLPVVVWDMPKLGTYNLHGSLLPRYRGAAPINWAVINGDKYTGVTTFKLKHAIDTGDLMYQEKVQITEDDNAGSVHDKMMIVGANLVLKTVKSIISADYQTFPQDESQVSKAPKIFHETCEIDFNKPSDEIYNFVRGLCPYPGAWMTLDGLEMKVFDIERGFEDNIAIAGTIITDDKRYIKIAASDGYIMLNDLKLQGKKRMDVKSFLNGYKMNEAFIASEG
jgi:methionyl-tRNA formyltransferase